MQEEVRGETRHEIKNIYTQKHPTFHTSSFVHFPHKKQIRRKKSPGYFLKVPIFIMDLLEKPQMGPAFKKADFTHLGPTTYQGNAWDTCRNIQKRQGKIWLT